MVRVALFDMMSSPLTASFYLIVLSIWITSARAFPKCEDLQPIAPSDFRLASSQWIQYDYESNIQAPSLNRGCEGFFPEDRYYDVNMWHTGSLVVNVIICSSEVWDLYTVHLNENERFVVIWACSDHSQPQETLKKPTTLNHFFDNTTWSLAEPIPSDLSEILLKKNYNLDQMLFNFTYETGESVICPRLLCHALTKKYEEFRPRALILKQNILIISGCILCVWRDSNIRQFDI